MTIDRDNRLPKLSLCTPPKNKLTPHDHIAALPACDIVPTITPETLWGQYFGRFNFTPITLRSGLLNGHDTIERPNHFPNTPPLIEMHLRDIFSQPDRKRLHTLFILAINGKLKEGPEVQTTLTAIVNPQNSENPSLAVIKKLRIQEGYPLESVSHKRRMNLQYSIQSPLWKSPKTGEQFAPEFPSQHLENIEKLLILWNVEDLIIHPKSPDDITATTETFKKLNFTEKSNGILCKKLCERQPHFKTRLVASGDLGLLGLA